MLILNKAQTQEEFIRGSMTKNPYSSAEIGPLMRDVKNKICQQLDLLGLLEDDYGMELLVAGNIISLDLSIAQVYELVWKKSNQSSTSLTNSALLASNAAPSRDCPPMTVTYRLQGLDGEATEPMIKELEEDREESQDPEIEFAIAGAVREYGGLEILLDMIKSLRDDFKSNQEEMVAVLDLLNHCCKIRENRRALLRLGALSVLLETARRAFSVDAMEPAEGILLIVESLTLEANESDIINAAQSALTVSNEETGTWEQVKKIVLMFLERLSHPSGLKKSNKQQRNTEMVARILPYLTYGELAAMEALIEHFNPYLQNWSEFDQLQQHHEENPKDDQGGPTQRINMAKSVSSYISSSSTSLPSTATTSPSDSRPLTPGSQLSSAGTEETIQFMMVNSLLSESYEAWLQHRRVFLQRGIYHTFMHHAHLRESSSSGSKTQDVETLTSDELLTIVRPMLVYTGMIEQLQQFFKSKKPVHVESNKKEGTSSGVELEPWEMVMKEKLLNVKEMVGFSKELISWLDEINSATDLQEAFDIVGVLADVLSGGVTQCDQFVRLAIDVGNGKG